MEIETKLWPETAYPKHLQFWPFKSALATGYGLEESIQPIPSGVTLRLVEGGAWTVSMLGKLHEVKSGDVFCCMPSEPVVFCQTRPGVAWKWHELQFNGPEDESFLPYFGLSAATPVITPVEPEQAVKCLERLHVLIESGNAAAFMATAFSFLAACGEQRELKTEGRASLIKRAKLLLEAGIHTDGAVEKLSVQLGVERTTLYRAFKEELGISPHEYIDTLRLIRVEELLGRTDISISKAASQSGFRDVKYFISWFKSKHGMSPGAWRKR